MIGQTNIAILALGHPAACVALYHRGKSTPVLEKYHLFVLFQRLAHILNQQGRERTIHPFLAIQFLDVHWYDFGQLYLFVPLGQGGQAILALLHVIPAIHRWGGGTQ